jgi:hypothetical protein
MQFSVEKFLLINIFNKKWNEEKVSKVEEKAFEKMDCDRDDH